MRARIWYPHERLKRRLPVVVSSEQTSDDEMVSRGKAGRKRRKFEDEISTVRRGIRVLSVLSPSRHLGHVGHLYPSAEGRLPESLHFAESDVILGVVRARSVHKIGYGHNCD